MISAKAANVMIAAGWIAAVIEGALTTILVFFSIARFVPANLIDAAILFGLAYGISRRSRICAALALIYQLANLVARFELQHIAYMSLGTGLAFVFAVCYAFALIGAIVWQSRTLNHDLTSFSSRV
jgi:hypothetical protein